jgi:D-beta-D-heptose 7-phosphate kinase/D-beta-D-heptose 1-phosphate adenosyltransferase
MTETPRPAPLLDAAGLDRFLEEARRAGLRLVFTNGCFDLIHPGHIAYLTEARSLGDRLILGLNTDASVRRLKGTGRPLVPQEGRAAVLAALRCVDAVTLFEEDTPRDLILRVRPHVLVKGGDYRPEEVVGAADLPAWGGVLRILPFVPGYSSSRLMDQLRNLKGNNPLSA